MSTTDINMKPYRRPGTRTTNLKRRNIFSSGRRKKNKSVLEPCYFQTEFFNRINDQLLTEILIRLPPKSACRYKGVCKRWCSLLSTPYFTTRVINLRRHRCNPPLAAPQTFTLLFQYVILDENNRSFYVSHLKAISNHPVLSKKKRKLELDFLPRPSLSDAYYDAKYTDVNKRKSKKKQDDDTHLMFIMGSCNDLLLCSHHGLYRFYVVNLLTRRWIMLPPTGPENSETFLEVAVEAFAGLLCYHDKSDINSGDGWYKFKVVVFPAYDGDRDRFFDPELCQFRLRIYCSESNQWTDFVVDWYPFAWTPLEYQMKAPILAHDGKLHWLNGCSLVSFDPFIDDSGQFLKLSHIIKLPDELVHHNPSCFGLCKGHFRVARHFLDEGRTFLHVWELRDYNKGVWQLSHTVLLNNSDLKDVIGAFIEPDFMAFHPFDEDLIFVRALDMIYQFNLRTGRREQYFYVKQLMGRGDMCKAVPPLLHQWFPTAVPSPLPPGNDMCND